MDRLAAIMVKMELVYGQTGCYHGEDGTILLFYYTKHVEVIVKNKSKKVHLVGFII